MKKERDRGRNRFFCKKRSRHGFQPSKKRPISLWGETTGFHDIDGKAPRRAVHDHVCREAHASRCCRGRRYEGRDAVRRELAVVCSALAGPHRATALARPQRAVRRALARAARARRPPHPPCSPTPQRQRLSCSPAPPRLRPPCWPAPARRRCARPRRRRPTAALAGHAHPRRPRRR